MLHRSLPIVPLAVINALSYSYLCDFRDTFVEFFKHLLTTIVEDLFAAIARKRKLNSARALILLHEEDTLVIVICSLSHDNVSIIINVRSITW